MGWWLLLGIVVGVVAITYIDKFLKKRKQFSRAVMREFDVVTSQFNARGDAQKLVMDLSVLLRKVSINAFPDKNVAGMTGQTWLQFLDEAVDQSPSNQRSTKQGSTKNGSTKFSSPLGQNLITAPYQKQLSLGQQDIQQLLLLCQQWVQTVARQSRPALETGVL